MAKETQPQEPLTKTKEQDRNEYQFRSSWLIVLALLIGMYAFLKSISPALTWDQIMTWMHVENRERYSMLAILCMTMILITAIWRILRQ
ncbi:MAG: hypothetical protein GY845_08700 [Planctomycetes bacterium]|nr:hypothetical protein [Planctomycetota bacterium]